MPVDRAPLQASIGHAFGDPGLLELALTHRSYGSPHNERLEFLGDSLLNCAVSIKIFQLHPQMPEGELSRLRANLVNQQTLAEIALDLGLGQHLLLGEGESKTGGQERPSILADAVEALLGAVYLDAGFEAALDATTRLMASRFESAGKSTPEKDAKTRLQEWLQARGLALPVYEVIGIAGEAHRQQFEVRCQVLDLNVMTTGQAANRRGAEQLAAQRALEAVAAKALPSTKRKSGRAVNT